MLLGCIWWGWCCMRCATLFRSLLSPTTSGRPATCSHFAAPTGIPNPSARQHDEIASFAALRERTRTFLALVATRGGLLLIENPSSSILWLDRAVQSWLRMHAPFSAHVAVCQYGLSLFKAWAFWSNHPVMETLACICPHPKGFHPSFARRRLSDESFVTRQTACYLSRLAAAIAKCIHPWLSNVNVTIITPLPKIDLNAKSGRWLKRRGCQ